MSPGAFSQEVSLWKKEAATKEINGLRRYGWALADGIGKTLENAPSDTFPAVNVFMRDFRTAFADVDPDVTPEKWKLIDVETQVIHNPNYWAAVYEIAPADPLLMWFHASLYAREWTGPPRVLRAATGPAFPSRHAVQEGDGKTVDFGRPGYLHW